MNVILSVEHPAWAHQFKFIIKALEKKGYNVKVVAIDKDRDLELLDSFGINYDLVGNSTGKNIFDKAWLLLSISFKIFKVCKKFKPDIFIGRASPMMALNAFLFKKPHVIFEDTERSTISLKFCKWFSSLIITPISFKTDLGDKQLRTEAFKELFYLHPSYFTPDTSVLDELGINDKDRFVFLRFVSWNASHDIGFTGLNNSQKIHLVKELEKHAKVFISSEENLPDELRKYEIKIAFNKIHSVLYYASLYIGEGATMASEAAILGTHAIFISKLTAGTLDEQEKKYGLVFNYYQKDKFERTLEKSIQLLSDNDLIIKGRNKSLKLVNEKVDMNELFLQKINEYANKK
jgi:uncharacterized protein